MAGEGGARGARCTRNRHGTRFRVLMCPPDGKSPCVVCIISVFFVGGDGESGEEGALEGDPWAPFLPNMAMQGNGTPSLCVVFAAFRHLQGSFRDAVQTRRDMAARSFYPELYGTKVRSCRETFLYGFSRRDFAEDSHVATQNPYSSTWYV